MKQFRIESYTDNDIYIFKSGGKQKTSAHTHNFLEIIYIFQGCACQRVDDREYLTETGDLLYVLPGEVHSFAPHGTSFLYYNILLKPALVLVLVCGQDSGMLLNKAKERELLPFFQERKALEPLLEHMLSECRSRHRCYLGALHGYAGVLLVWMQKSLLHQRTDVSQIRSGLGSQRQCCLR